MALFVAMVLILEHLTDLTGWWIVMLIYFTLQVGIFVTMLFGNVTSVWSQLTSLESKRLAKHNVFHHQRQKRKYFYADDGKLQFQVVLGTDDGRCFKDVMGEDWRWWFVPLMPSDAADGYEWRLYPPLKDE